MLLDFTTLPAFLLASAVVVLTPGVDAFLLLRTSLRQGIGAGLRALLGIHTASILQVALVICGLGTLITNNPAVLATLKWAGAAYLVYLAVMIVRGLWLTRKETGDGLETGSTTDRPYLQGLLSNITNPKMLLFSLAFLPQFVGAATAPTLQLVLLGAVFLVLAAIWEVTIVLAAARIADRLRRPKIARSLDMISAAAFLTISVGLVTT
ncbi:LysE family translocator [Saccharopolyspora gloriosae]|uniref:Threonine/homoserine/homoserine lactone efflux protein n=1 Tax=Saccharopolyspora gloriosae TaxID=455344 RepID=A0A840NHH6_9PSEU|nr:LysE family translocator [Saccharopolyspora gloriosae]MBB5071340.1 threonine/homoserine/homoserine lactone efflux protein [Saccharopolyspora gloriosae]